MEKWKQASFISVIAIFAALGIVSDSFSWLFQDLSSVWRSWIFIIEPINGILLIPPASFFSTIIGVLVGHSVFFRGNAEFIFTMGAPIGAAVTSFLFRRKWKIPMIYFIVLLGAYFLTPVSWKLPFWGMWDVYLAFGCLILMVVIMIRWKNLWSTQPTGINLIVIIALSAFIGLEADVLFRIFILVPGQTYHIIYGLSVEQLQAWWAVGAVETSIKASLSTIVSIVIVPSVLRAVQRMRSRSSLKGTG
ncbi:MAG: hypothetical protein PVF96_08795 [Candidatus Bathyarchaeota archaeon]